MYQTSLYFKLKDAPGLERHHILELFFKSWVDGTCNNEVDYELETRTGHSNPAVWEETYRVDFEHIEDAVALKLKGVPLDFQKYIELVT